MLTAVTTFPVRDTEQRSDFSNVSPAVILRRFPLSQKREKRIQAAMLTEGGGAKVQMLRKEFVWICYKNPVEEEKKQR